MTCHLLLTVLLIYMPLILLSLLLTKTFKLLKMFSLNMGNVSGWLVKNKLSLNLGKTESILFASKKKLKTSNSK